MGPGPWDGAVERDDPGGRVIYRLKSEVQL